MPPSVPLLFAACRALDVTPIGWPDGRLELTGPDAAVLELAPHIRAQVPAFLAFLKRESDRGHARQRDGFRVVRVYDVAHDRWGDVARTSPLVGVESCHRDPQRAAILAAFRRATMDTERAAA